MATIIEGLDAIPDEYDEPPATPVVVLGTRDERAACNRMALALEWCVLDAEAWCAEHVHAHLTIEAYRSHIGVDAREYPDEDAARASLRPPDDISDIYARPP